MNKIIKNVMPSYTENIKGVGEGTGEIFTNYFRGTGEGTGEIFDTDK